MANPADAEEGKRALTLTSQQEGLEDGVCSLHLSLIRSISLSRGGWWPQAVSQQSPIWPVLAQAAPWVQPPVSIKKSQRTKTSPTTARTVSRFILKGTCKCHHEKHMLENKERNMVGL